jgi:hypothetical protein
MKTKNHRVDPKRLALAVGLSVAGFAQLAQAAIVGYDIVPLTNGYNFIANPLDQSASPGGNSITNVMNPPPDGTSIYLWDINNQAFTPPSIYSITTSNWSINYVLPVGRGFVLQTSRAWTNTFVGEVLEGHLTNFVAGSNKFSLLGSMVPLVDTLSNLSFPGTDGDNVYVFKTPNQMYSDALAYFAGYGWFDPNGAVATNGPVVNVAQALFVQNPGPDTNWIINYTNSTLSSAASQDAALTFRSGGAEIQSLSISPGVATLRIPNSGGAKYDVEFSIDRLVWTAVATNQTENVWTGPRPGGPHGYYRLTTR